MTRSLILFTAAAGLALGGCMAPSVWSKPGLTQEEWLADSYACERDTRGAAQSFGGGIDGMLQARDFLARCLRSKGYAQMPR